MQLLASSHSRVLKLCGCEDQNPLPNPLGHKVKTVRLKNDINASDNLHPKRHLHGRPEIPRQKRALLQVPRGSDAPRREAHTWVTTLLEFLPLQADLVIAA